MADKFLDKTGLAYFWEKIKAYFQSQHITPPEYTIVRLANEEVGYAASYVLKKDGTQVGATINIPKDYLVRSGEVKTVTVADEPYEGAVVGDKYLDFVVNTIDDSGNISHIYIPVSDLVDAYIAGNGIHISDNNYISVKVSQQGVDHGLGVGGDGLTVRMVTPSVNGVGGTHGAMYAADKEKLDNLEIVGVFTSDSDTDPVVEGVDGLVPAPTWAERSKFLRGDGTWAEPDGGGGTPNVGNLKTNNTSALTPSASEPFTGDINLHKVSKTGSYNDLNNKPTIPSSGDFVTSLGTSGNNLTWTKDGTTNNITVPYATKAEQDSDGKAINTSYVKVNPQTGFYNSNTSWNLYLTGSFQNTHYVRITMPDTTLSVWAMFYFEVSIMQKYSDGACGKLYFFAMHNSTTGDWSYLRGTVAGNISTSLSLYGSDRKYLYISGINGYGSVSIDKILCGDSVRLVDITGITLDTVTQLPETYQTGVIYGAGAYITWDSNGLRLLDSRNDVLSTLFSGGTSSQFVKADGSVDSSTYLTSANLPTYTVEKISTPTSGYRASYRLDKNSEAIVGSDTIDIPNEFTPLISKEYLDNTFYASTTSVENSSRYFMTVTPDSENTFWYVKFRVRVWIPVDTTDKRFTDSIIEYFGSGISMRCYRIWNTINTGSAAYYQAAFWLTASGLANGFGHVLGTSIRYGTNYTNSAWYRYVKVDLLAYEGCTVDVFDELTKWTPYKESVGASSSDYLTDQSTYNATSQGLQETGDTTDTTNMYLTYARFTAGTNGIMNRSLIMEDSQGKWQSFTTTSGTGTSKTKNTSGFRLGSKIFYMSSSTDIAPDAILGTSLIRAFAPLVDFRYTINITTTAGGANNLVPYKPLYIVGTIGNDGLFYLDDVWWAQDEPSTENGKIYIKVSPVIYNDYSNDRCYRGDLLYNGDAYWYKNGRFKRYYDIDVDASANEGNNIVKLNGRSGQYGVTPHSLCAFAISTSAILEIIEPFTTTGGINGKPVRQGVTFPIGCKIYYHPDYNDISANTDFTSKEFYSTYDEVDARYTAVTGQNISLYSSSQSGVYLRVNVDNGYWSPYYKPNDTTEIIVTPHDFQNGNFYIYLGKTVGSTGYKFQLEDNNPLYYYDGTKLIDWATYQASASMPSYTAGDGISISNGVISCTPRPYKKEVFTAASFNANSVYEKSWQNFIASSNLEVGTYKVTLQVHLYIVANDNNMMPAGCVVNVCMRSKETASSPSYQYILGATETFSGGVLPETSIPTGKGIISKALNVVGFMEITGDEDSGCSLEVKFTTNSSLNVRIGNPTPLDGSYAGLCSGNDFVLLEKIA